MKNIIWNLWCHHDRETVSDWIGKSVSISTFCSTTFSVGHVLPIGWRNEPQIGRKHSPRVSRLHPAKSGIFVILADFPIHSSTQIRVSRIPGGELSIRNGHHPSQVTVYHHQALQTSLGCFKAILRYYDDFLSIILSAWYFYGFSWFSDPLWQVFGMLRDPKMRIIVEKT